MKALGIAISEVSMFIAADACVVAIEGLDLQGLDSSVTSMVATPKSFMSI